MSDTDPADPTALRKMAETVAALLGRYRASLREAGFSGTESMELVRQLQAQMFERGRDA